MSDKSLWERIVQLSIAAGERVLAPIERFIGSRSLVGEATFFENDRFPWIKEIEANWDDDQGRAGAGPGGQGGAAELPRHLQGPDRDHRRR